MPSSHPAQQDIPRTPGPATHAETGSTTGPSAELSAISDEPPKELPEKNLRLEQIQVQKPQSGVRRLNDSSARESRIATRLLSEAGIHFA